jgi:hypothetical protein
MGVGIEQRVEYYRQIIVADKFKPNGASVCKASLKQNELKC